MTATKAEFPEKLKFLFEPARYKVLYGGRGGAKCLGLGTPVLMFNGTIKTVEEVVVGDLLMGPDSTPRTVISTIRGESELFQINQTSAMTYVVNDEHVLSLKKSKSSSMDMGGIMPSGNLRRPRGRYPDWPDVTNIRIRDYIAQSKRWKENFHGYRAGLIQFDPRPVPVDPYLLGVWLGDGLHRELMITSADEEIIEWMREFCARNGLIFTKGGKKGNLASDYRLGRNPAIHGRWNPVWGGFKELGIVSNKHIPQIYLSNGEEVRLQVLAGLVDTDGTMARKGYTITLANERLANEVKRLADTLGFRTSISKTRTVCTNNGVYGVAWRVGMNGDCWKIPCKVERKKIKKEDYNSNKDKTLSYLSVKSIGVGPYAGFAVDGDHLFCLADGTVTHNSWGTARALLIQAAATPLRILCAREFQSSIVESVHHLLHAQIESLGLGAFYEVQNSAIRGANGSEFVFAGLRNNVTKIKSFEGVDRVWVEEAQTVSKSSWEVLIPTIRKDHSEIWVTFNPELETDETYRRFVVHPPADAISIKINWNDNPWFPKTLAKEKDELKARDPDAYQNVWEGNCRVTLDGAIYARELRLAQEEGRIHSVPHDKDRPVHTFFDLGWADSTCIWFAQTVGGELRLIDYYCNNQMPIQHYISVLQNKGYLYGTDWLPHDARAKEQGSGRSVEEVMIAAGRKVRIVPNLSISDGINAARMLFGRCHFDEENCAEGLQSLRHYRYDVDPETKQFSGRPLHDWSSHAADAFRYLAVAVEDDRPAVSARGVRIAGWRA